MLTMRIIIDIIKNAIDIHYQIEITYTYQGGTNDVFKR